MVVKIQHVENFQSALFYNEDKVSQGHADFLDTGHFLKDPAALSHEEKLERFMMRFDRNISVKSNCLHITLNFSPEDKLTSANLKAIAASYLKLIGLNYEPYLFYEHRDTAHPHIHLITTPIKSNGEKVQLFNVGSKLLNPARERIEKEFNLIGTGSGMTRNQGGSVKVVNYGADPTRESIEKVLDRTINTYRYTSLEELNAVLSVYNVAAFLQRRSRFKECSGALWYFVTNTMGQPLSAPIKSSAFSVKATWKYISEKFALNHALRQTGQSRIKNAVYFAGSDNPVSVEAFVEGLKRQGIDAKFKKSADGSFSSLTYIDHTNGNVFDARSLGEQYETQTVLSRLGYARKHTSAGAQTKQHNRDVESLSADGKYLSSQSYFQGTHTEAAQINTLSDLLKPSFDYGGSPSFKRKRKKRRRKIS